MNLSLPLFPELDGLPAPPGGPQAAGQPVPAAFLPATPPAAARQPAHLLRDATQGDEHDDPISSALTDPLAGLQGQHPPSPRDPAALHPAVWRASQIGGAPRRTTASGFALLDAQLPGGGWPHGVLTELLLPHPGVGELRLLAPALAAVAPAVATPNSGPGGGHGRCVMLFDPPAALSAWALLQCGLNSRHWLVVQARAGQGGSSPPNQAHQAHQPKRSVPRSANRLAPLLPGADVLWALEQALKSGHVGAILAWLPLRVPADALRRLQIAAQAHDGPVFILRDVLAASRPSPAPLRLLLQPAGVDGLALRLLKRRGPPLAQPLRLVLPSVLAPHLQAQAQADDLLRQAAVPARGAAARG